MTANYKYCPINVHSHIIIIQIIFLYAKLNHYVRHMVNVLYYFILIYYIVVRIIPCAILLVMCTSFGSHGDRPI